MTEAPMIDVYCDRHEQRSWVVRFALTHHYSKPGDPPTWIAVPRQRTANYQRAFKSATGLSYPGLGEPLRGVSSDDVVALHRALPAGVTESPEVARFMDDTGPISEREFSRRVGDDVSVYMKFILRCQGCLTRREVERGVDTAKERLGVEHQWRSTRVAPLLDGLHAAGASQISLADLAARVNSR